jgi:serine/threonine protein kinase
MVEKHIGDYRILKQIGVGGMAKVYLAVHKDVPNLQVVLKVLSDPRLAERFKHEADKLALLDKNPNVCKIRHFFNHGDEFVIAMEYIEGPSLEEILEEEGRLSIPRALEIVLDILTALEPAHEQEIFHRDIKPSNIMFAKSGQVKIIDFGIAKGKTDPQLTIVGTAAGTPEYMAPEQFEAREDLDYSKCDIYAIGIMLFRMLTGELPFKGANEFVMRDSKLFDTPVAPSKLNKDINKELGGIIIKSIQSEPDKRLASIAEMKAALQRVLESYKSDLQTHDTIVTPRPAAVSVTAGKRGMGGRRLSLVAVMSVVVVAAAVLIIFKVIPRGRESSQQERIEAPGGQEDRGGQAVQSGRTSLDDQTTSGGRSGTGDQAGTAGQAGAGGQAKSETDGKTASGETPVKDRPEDSRPAKQPVPKPALGRIVVGSKPRYGDIYIDGVLQNEKTPYTFDVSPGRHVIKIVLTVDGVEHVHTATITVESDSTKRVMYEL